MVRTLLPLLLDGSGSVRSASGIGQRLVRPALLYTVPLPHVVFPMRPVNPLPSVVLHCTTNEGTPLLVTNLVTNGPTRSHTSPDYPDRRANGPRSASTTQHSLDNSS